MSDELAGFLKRGLNAQKAIDALGAGRPEPQRVPVETLERASEPFLMIEDCAAAWRRAFRAKEAGEPDNVTQHLLIATDLSVRLAGLLKR